MPDAPLLDDYDPVPGLIARGIASNEHDPDSCDAECCVDPINPPAGSDQ